MVTARLARVRLPLLALLVCVLATAQAQPRRDLGGFSLQLPAAMTLLPSGTDSHGGRLVGDALQIEYDLGLYSDPLQPREGVSGREERAVVVDGLPARLVRWRVEQPAPAHYFVGLHLPQVSVSTMGPIRLTLLAYGSDLAKMEDAQAMLLSLRMTPAARR